MSPETAYAYFYSSSVRTFHREGLSVACGGVGGRGAASHEISNVGLEADQGDKTTERHDAAYTEKGVP